MRRRLIAGTINRYAPESGWENVHLDKSGRELYDLKRRRFSKPAEVVCDLVDAGAVLEPASFDEVRCWQVLEHLVPKAAPVALAAFYRVLKPGGVLDVEVPNVQDVVIAWMENDLSRDDALGNIYGQSTDMPDDEYNAHRWGYTPFSLQELLHAAGFKPIERIAGDAPVVEPLRFRAVKP